MPSTTPLFQDKVRLLYKEFSHTTANGNSVHIYIVERLERFDNDQQKYKPYGSYDTIKLTGYQINQTAWDYITIQYTRKNKNSWDFKLLSADYSIN